MNNQDKLNLMKQMTFGTELEYEGISRLTAIRAIASVVGGTPTYRPSLGHEAWATDDAQGRVWKAVRDGSLTDGCEVVTPVLKWDDFDTLQKVVRALRQAGARVPSTTSQHVHVGCADFTPAQLANLARIFYKQERLILKAAGTLECRLARYTRPTDPDFIARLERARPTTMQDFNKVWFGVYTPYFRHYNDARYRAINFNNMFDTKKTVEFRLFNGTNHAGKVKAHIQLCLAIAAMAKTAKAASSKNQRPFTEESAKYDTRVFLLRLGMIGPEFKTARKLLLANLPGSAAWKHGRRA